MATVQKMPSDKRREQILKKATILFSRHGYDTVTMASLAAACNISEPALYRHFKSKKEIYTVVLASLKDKINISSLASELSKLDDIEEILFTFTKRLLNMYLLNPEIARLLLFCSLEGHSQTKNVFEVIRIPYIELLVKTLKRLRRKKLIHPVDPLLTARCFTGMVTECAIGANLWRKLQGKSVEPNRILNNTVPIFARGLKI